MDKPKDEHLKTILNSFLLRHQSHHRPIALITSGGTQTHLERNPVRYIDNFSTGYRGALSAEYFLQQGYAVIHLWRKGSASPYARCINGKLGLKCNETLNEACIDELFEEQEDVTAGNVEYIQGADYPRLHPRLVYDSEIRTMLRERKRTVDHGLLMTVPFVTLEEYLHNLELCCSVLDAYGCMALIYLAAAVSDFWIPPTERSEHKIQSASSPQSLVLELKPVPKKIGCIRKEWAPKAFCVSFKLETDEAILEQKARSAVEKYGVHCVVANLLHTRHEVVHVLHPSETGHTMTEIRNKKSNNVYLEEKLVNLVISEHYRYISSFPPHVIPPDVLDFFKAKRDEYKSFLWWNTVKQYGWELFCSGVGIFISYWISSALRKRIEGHR